MKNRGFTLIELLAVLTILSIILLIAVFSISSVISNSKSNLHDTQLKQILRAAEYYNSKEGTGDSVQNVSVKYLSENGYLKDDEVKDPKTGKIMDGSVIIRYNGKKYSYKYKEDGTICISKDNEVSTEPGSKYECEVKDGEKFNFYVLSESDDGKINLIMDSNICASDDPNKNGKQIPNDDDDNACLIAWYTTDYNSNGPVIAMQGLYQATKDWDYLPNIIFSYEDEGFNEDPQNGYKELKINDFGIYITNYFGEVQQNISGKEAIDGTIPTIAYEENQKMKTRLPKYSEVTGTGCTGSPGSCPNWLIENLVETGKCIDKEYCPYNYWLLKTYMDDAHPAHNSAFVIENSGIFNVAGVDTTDFSGIRPVITVPKNFLSASSSN